MKIPAILKQIAEKIDKKGGKPILVGGAVRDYLLGIESKDLDVEVFGLAANQLITILKKFGRVSVVGKAFGVLKLTVDNDYYDFSLPRNDLKIGLGHKGFHIKTDPSMTFEEAASRRDFTINAMGYNIITHKILDAFGGQTDLKKRILRVVNPNTFVEDPLRVLRGIQFAARFNLNVPENTLSIFRDLTYTLQELPKERIYIEIEKLLLKSTKPSLGLKLADTVGVIKKLFPELNALHKTVQDVESDKKSNFWQHTMRVVDEAVNLKNNDEFHDLCLMFAVLCHAFGKPHTVCFSNGKRRSLNNSQEGIKSTRSFLDRLTNEIKLVDTIESLVGMHLQPLSMFQSRNVSDGAIRRLSMKVDIPLLIDVARADYYGNLPKETKNKEFPAGRWLLDRYNQLELYDKTKLQPILLGRHLIDLGLKPGVQFGKVLQDAFELQLDDKFNSLDDALIWARKQVGNT